MRKIRKSRPEKNNIKSDAAELPKKTSRLPSISTQLGFLALVCLVIYQAFFNEVKRDNTIVIPPPPPPSAKNYSYLENSPIIPKPAAVKRRKQPTKTVAKKSLKCASPKAKPKLKTWNKYMVKTQYAAVRRGPSVKYEKVGALTYGKSIKAQKVGQSWVRIDYGRFVRNPDLLNLDEEPKTDILKRWVAVKKLLARNLPVPTAQPVDTYQRGEQIEVQKIDELWLRVIKQGSYIKNEGLASTAIFPTVFPAKMQAISRVNIRQGAGKDFPTIGIFFKDKIFEVQGIQDGWARLANDQYVSTSLLIKADHGNSLSKSQKQNNSL